MKRLFLLGVWLGLGVLAAPLTEIRIEGGDPVLQALARASLPFGLGDEPQDLEEARRALLATGYFKEVGLALEGSVLRITLLPNPPIRGVRVEARAFPERALLEFLERLAVGPGATYNPKRAEEAAQALAEAYRREGFPFRPKVTFRGEEGPEGILLTFKVEEDLEVKEVRLEGVSLLPLEGLLRLLEPLKGRFDFARYREALGAIAERYEGAGYRYSGPLPQASELKEGLLVVRVRELKVAGLEGEGLDLEGFPLGPGDYLNYDRLLAGVEALSQGLGRVVDFALEDQGEGVVIRLGLGPEGGRIQGVEIQGVTAFREGEILGLLRLGPGKVYTPALAQEDARRIAAYYREKGYEVAAVAPSFQGGIYRLEVKELRIVGYRLEWAGGRRTQDEVILRELPPPGSLFQVQALREALSRILATGLLAEPPRVGLVPEGEGVVVALGLKEGRTGLFQPAIGWSSLEGWSGSLALKETNLFGLAHQVEVNLAFVQNEARDNLSFGAGYTIPWLYLDLGDLKAVRTRVGLGLYSQPIGNLPLYQGSADTGWQYTERRSGLSLSLSRPLSRDLPNLNLSLGLAVRRSQYLLEVYDPKAPCDPGITDPSNPRYCDGTGYKDPNLAQSLLPTPDWTVRLDGEASYLEVDSPRFRTQGYQASLATGLGLSFPDSGGRTFFVPLVATGKTYFGLDEGRRQVLALRLSGGVLLGLPPEGERFYLSGSGPEAFLLRGHEDRKYSGYSFLTGSLEYRYDFRLSPNGGTNLYGILFGDLGLTDNTGGLKWGVGIGVQLDLEVLGALLPSLRLDYGFSPENRGGVLHFRIGPMF